MTLATVDPERDRAWHLAERERMANQEYLAPFLAPLSITDGSVLVDIGCGGGYINSFVAARHRMSLNIGLDLDPQTMRLARDLNRQAQSVHWLCASAEALSLQSGSVDFLVCRGVVPLARVHRVLSEIGRIMKPGARAVILLHSWSFYLRWLSLHPRRWKRSAAGLLHFALGVWFNLTGQQLRVRWRGRPIGQTFQTEFRMRRLLRRYGLELERAVQRPEFVVYARKA